MQNNNVIKAANEHFRSAKPKSDAGRRIYYNPDLMNKIASYIVSPPPATPRLTIRKTFKGG